MVHPASYMMGTGDSFPGGKVNRAWSWPQHYEWVRYTFTLPVSLHDVYRTTLLTYTLYV
jgi:hypothetical protein